MFRKIWETIAFALYTGHAETQALYEKIGQLEAQQRALRAHLNVLQQKLQTKEEETAV